MYKVSQVMEGKGVPGRGKGLCEGSDSGEDLSHWRSIEEVGSARAQGAGLGVASESCFLLLPAAGTEAGRRVWKARAWVGNTMV